MDREFVMILCVFLRRNSRIKCARPYPTSQFEPGGSLLLLLAAGARSIMATYYLFSPLCLYS